MLSKKKIWISTLNQSWSVKQARHFIVCTLYSFSYVYSSKYLSNYKYIMFEVWGMSIFNFFWSSWWPSIVVEETFKPIIICQLLFNQTEIKKMLVNYVSTLKKILKGLDIVTFCKRYNVLIYIFFFFFSVLLSILHFVFLFVFYMQ